MSYKTYVKMKDKIDKKLFYVVGDGENSVTIHPGSLMGYITALMEDYGPNTNEEDLPVLTIAPAYMTQEDFEKMPEHNG